MDIFSRGEYSPEDVNISHVLIGIKFEKWSHMRLSYLGSPDDSIIVYH